MKAVREFASNPDVAIALIARQQYGVVSRDQALAAGVSSSGIYRRNQSGEWHSIYPSVYSLASSPSSQRQTLVAACIWAGPEALASHRAAAAILGLDGCQDYPIEISVERSLSSRYGIVVHRAQLLAFDRTTRDGIPVTTPTRTLCDLSRFLDRDSLEIALDGALRRGLTSMPRLRMSLKRAEGLKCLRLKNLRELVDERSVVQPQMASAFEVKLARVLRDSRLPEPRRQFEVRQAGRLLGRVDFAYPDSRFAIEADSYRYHSGKQAWRNDAARNNRLMRAGWRILHVHWEDLRRPAALVAQILEALNS